MAGSETKVSGKCTSIEFQKIKKNVAQEFENIAGFMRIWKTPGVSPTKVESKNNDVPTYITTTLAQTNSFFFLKYLGWVFLDGFY